MLIDIHSHLDHCYFKDDLDKVIDNAKKANLKVILTAGINPETNRKALQIAEKYDIVKPCLGIYPIQTLQKEIDSGDYPLKENKFDIDEEIRFIEKNKNKITAVGEVGLDYFWIKDKQKEQKELFEKMISLAEKINKPIIVHSRKAEEDAVNILQSSKLKKIIMHCFSGKKALVKKIIDNNWFATIPTNVTKSFQFQENTKLIPITQLFCETDSPYLTPFKDQRNEPAFVLESYKKIAEIKGMELKEVINNIYMNWQKIF
jgi:TatD DNase family protein|tara:strand:+ start:10508 stop:11287 length:780 start_codon:yes stop_codon:yes gene_type:complete